jgi:hypothetical protein
MTFAARAGVRDVATTPEPGDHGGPALGVFDAGADEHHVRAVGEMRHECLGEHERAEVVRGERRVPALSILRGAHPHDACVIDQSREREIERDDLRGRATHAREIRQVAHDRHRRPARALDRLLHLVEPSAVPARQDDRAVRGQLDRRAVADARMSV